MSRWFYGAPNMVGAGLAAGVLAVFIGGLISGPLVPVLVVGAYVLGAVATPRPKPLLRAGGADGLDDDALLKALGELSGEAHKRLPEDLASKVDAIQTTITEMLPLVNGASVGRDELFAIERTVTDYLPTTVNAYLRLPRRYADSKPIQDGKTAHDMLGEQLDLIDSKMRDISDALSRDDAARLLAQSRFLEDRFGKHDDLALPPPDPAARGSQEQSKAV